MVLRNSCAIKKCEQREYSIKTATLDECLSWTVGNQALALCQAQVTEILDKVSDLIKICFP